MEEFSASSSNKKIIRIKVKKKIIKILLKVSKQQNKYKYNYK